MAKKQLRHRGRSVLKCGSTRRGVYQVRHLVLPGVCFDSPGRQAVSYRWHSSNSYHCQVGLGAQYSWVYTQHISVQLFVQKDLEMA